MSFRFYAVRRKDRNLSASPSDLKEENYVCTSCDDAVETESCERISRRI